MDGTTTPAAVAAETRAGEVCSPAHAVARRRRADSPALLARRSRASGGRKRTLGATVLVGVVVAVTALASTVMPRRGSDAGERIPIPGGRASIVPSIRAWAGSQEGRDPAAIFGQLCAVCHGEEGEGDGPVAGSMVPQPADLTDPERMGDLADEELVEVLRDGKGTMPSFGAVLESGEIRAMVRHIRELSGTEGGPQDGDTP